MFEANRGAGFNVDIWGWGSAVKEDSRSYREKQMEVQDGEGKEGSGIHRCLSIIETKTFYARCVVGNSGYLLRLRAGAVDAIYRLSGVAVHEHPGRCVSMSRRVDEEGTRTPAYRVDL